MNKQIIYKALLKIPNSEYKDTTAFEEVTYKYTRPDCYFVENDVTSAVRTRNSGLARPPRTSPTCRIPPAESTAFPILRVC